MKPENNIAQTLGIEPVLSSQTADNQPAELPAAKLTGRGGPGRGQGRKAAVNEITHIRQGFYGLIDRDIEAQDLQRAWDMLKSIAINKALNEGDTEDLRWYLNKFIPNADRDSAVNIAVGTDGMQPMITITIPNSNPEQESL